MCGRYVRKTGALEIAQAFSAVANSAELSLNFNISPTSDVYVLRGVEGLVQLDVMSWGLVPVWAKDVSSCEFDQRAVRVGCREAFVS
jgi:putative SOS response-associated peptidase YedK